MQKLKLLPSLKQKKRYLVYEIIAKEPVQEQYHTQLVLHLKSDLGVLADATSGLQLVHTNQSKGILRIDNMNVDRIKLMLGLVDNLGQKAAIMQSVLCSGILDKAKKQLL
jgi:RNase P/RNase MRP subunit POP5